MSAMRPIEITKDNDFTLSVGPVRGVDPDDGTVKDYPGTSVDAWLATAADSDTPLGGVTVTAPKVGTHHFIPNFEASQVNIALAAHPSLSDGTPLWCVVKAADDFRRAIELVYRAARTT